MIEFRYVRVGATGSKPILSEFVLLLEQLSVH